MLTILIGTMEALHLNIIPDLLFLMAVAGSRWLYKQYKPLAEQHSDVIAAAVPVAEATANLLEVLDLEIMDALPGDSLRDVALIAAKDLFDDGQLGRESFDAVYKEALGAFDLGVLAERMERG